MSRARNFALAAAIFLGFAAVAVLMVLLRPDPPVAPTRSQVPYVSVAPARAGSGPIPVHGAGTVRPRAEVEVAAQVAGKVAWVAPAFQSGGRVRQGQVLFRIEDADYQNRVRQARANVAAQQVALLQAQEEVRIARSEYERFRRRRAGETESKAVGPLALREPQLAAARAALARDSATLADAELALSRTEVRAPFGGIVRSESVASGRFVAPGQAVGRLYADDAVEVVVPLADADAALLPGLWELRAGDGDRRMAVRVFARFGDGSRSWAGYVDRAETALDERTRTVHVIVRIPGPFRGSGPPLLVGQFVDARIDGGAADPWFALPRPALRAGDEVWAVRSDSAIAVVPVRVLQRPKDSVLVAGDLRRGEPVVVGGISFATEGMIVRTRQAAPPDDDGPR